MKRIHLQRAAAVLLLALSGCSYVKVTVPTVVSESDLKAKAVANQKGDIPATFKTLEVDNSLGEVRIIGIESGPAEWKWTLTARAITEPLAQEFAQSAICKAEGDKDTLKLTVTLPDTKGKGRYESDLEIRVPKSVAIQAKNRYGRTEISDFTADVEADGRSGAMEIRNATGKVRAQNAYATLKVSNTGSATLRNQSGSTEAVGVRGSLDVETSYATLIVRNVVGPVRLRNQSGSIELAKSEGDVDLKTAYAELAARDIKGNATLANQSGAIRAEGISGSVKANTSYATLNLRGLTGANVECQNQSGSIELHVTPAITNLEAKTSYASLEVHLPAALTPAIQARTTYADIESDFPVLMKPASKDALAEVVPGTPRINLQNQSGRIRVIKD